MQAPRRGTKQFRKVLEAGCGFNKDHYNGDGNCEHEYDWICDNCPINVNKEAQKLYRKESPIFSFFEEDDE